MWCWYFSSRSTSCSIAVRTASDGSAFSKLICNGICMDGLYLHPTTQKSNRMSGLRALIWIKTRVSRRAAPSKPISGPLMAVLRHSDCGRPRRRKSRRCVPSPFVPGVRRRCNPHEGDLICPSKALRMKSSKRLPRTGFSTIEIPAAAARLRKLSLGRDVTRIAGIIHADLVAEPPIPNHSSQACDNQSQGSSR